MGDDNYRTAMLDAVEQDGRLVELVLPQDSGFAPRLFGVKEHGALGVRNAQATTRLAQTSVKENF